MQAKILRDNGQCVADTGKPFIKRTPKEPPSSPRSDSVNTSVGPPDVQVRPGQQLTIACGAEGRPDPEIAWDVDGQSIVTGERYNVGSDGSLVISSVQREDEGSYTCTATNTNGDDRATIDVVVPGR